MALLVQEDVPVPEEPVFFLGSVIPLEVLSDDLCAIGVHLLGARFLAPRISVPPQPLAPVHLAIVGCVRDSGQSLYWRRRGIGTYLKFHALFFCFRPPEPLIPIRRTNPCKIFGTGLILPLLLPSSCHLWEAATLEQFEEVVTLESPYPLTCFSSLQVLKRLLGCFHYPCRPLVHLSAQLADSETDVRPCSDGQPQKFAHHCLSLTCVLDRWLLLFRKFSIGVSSRAPVLDGPLDVDSADHRCRTAVPPSTSFDPHDTQPF